uniref:C2H2-type domain-containing protein n=1 Tax=Ascaris lumbricoides TaxID=6252 RepID=A0A9J2PG91_ASCLU
MSYHEVSKHRAQCEKSILLGHNDQLPDCHLCGLCSAKFYDVDRFIDHKRTCCSQKQKSITPPCSDTESAPIDLSRKTILDDFDGNKNLLDDKANVLFDPIGTLQQHQQQLLELYAQLAASQSVRTDSEQSSEDGRNPSYLLSPPSSNDTIDKVHPCAAETCTQRFSSRGALLWHVLRRHPEDKLLQCNTCDERFTDPDQVREHRCGVAPRPASTGALLRSTSPDVDRGSVPAHTDGSFSVVSKSPSPAPSSLSTMTPSTAGSAAPFSQMFFSQLLNSVSSAAVAATPTNPAKDIALDLSTSVGNNTPFLPLPSMPQHLMRPPMNFTLNAHRSPNPETFLGATQSNSLLNNDDDWEALMEVSTTDEAEKIRALVGDKALPTTDPNQCLLCRRVLSCKSALQMHYRTHTGERPFKCKICQRAFTTKGNLKTHMGVHRAKHSFRGIGSAPSIQHQCPICQKRFFTAQLLQQHIAHHTNQLTRNNIMPPYENAMGSQSFERRPELGPTSSGVVASTSQPLLQMSGAGLMRPLSNGLMPPFPTPFPFFPLGLPRPMATSLQQQQQQQQQTSAHSLQPSVIQSHSTNATSSRPQQTSEACEPKPEVASPPSTPSLSEPLSASLSLQSMLNTTLNDTIKIDETERRSDLNTTPSNSALPTTLCNICFKTFACQSALEIHYRSHTKDRPFKCSECGRGFSTKGNMKQHLLTHRIRCAQSPDDGSVDESFCCDDMDQSEPSSSGRLIECENEDQLGQQQQQLQQTHSHTQSRDLCKSETPTRAETPTVQSPEPSQTSTNTKENNEMKSCSAISTMGSTPNPLDAMQKMWAETEPPPPRQAPVLSKHQCGVCFKHFSSSSALQIHMRTHTGDKPFKCEVCGRAFTTRGNLKVHMGTHMWQQNPSRRGRRIFEFCADSALHPELLSPLGTIGPDASIRPPFDTPLRPPFPDSIRNGPPAFPGLPFPLPMLPGTNGPGGAAAVAAASSQMDAVMWMWRTVCSVCQKVCASPHELEQHLKMHLNGTANVNNNSSPAMLLQKSD